METSNILFSIIIGDYEMYKTLLINENNSIESIIELEIALNILPGELEMAQLPENVKFQIETRSKDTDILLHLENIIWININYLLEKTQKELIREFRSITDITYLLIDVDEQLNKEIFSKILAIDNPYLNHFYVCSIGEYYNLLSLILNRGVYHEYP